MHVALIIDEQRLAQEQAMLNRLCIGLMAEGMQLTRIVPDLELINGIDKGEQRVGLAPRIEAPMRVLPWMRRSRAARIADALERNIPDILYAIGQRAWRLALDLSQVIERPVALDVWSTHEARIAPRAQKSSAIATYITCTGSIARALRRRVGDDMVSVVPMGVAIPPDPRAILSDPDQPAALAIVGGARDLGGYDSLLGGLSRIVPEHPQLHIFLELHGPNENQIWRRAERLDLLPCVSAIGEASLYRSLVTRCDLLLMPERSGELRSLMLEAMALGIPVIAREDSALDMLIEGQTALLVGQSQAQEWTQRIRQVLREPKTARDLGLRARQMVIQHHRSSDQVARLVDVLQQTQAGGTLRFRPENEA